MKKIYSNLLTKKNLLILLSIIVFLWVCYNLYKFKEGFLLGENLTECPPLGGIPEELIDQGIKCPDNNFKPIPSAPTQEGCYRFLPKGCTKRGGGGKFSWARDTWGEKNRCAGLDKNQCVDRRLKDFNSYCGISDTKMHWNPPTSMKVIPPTPTEPGCYRFLPKGCTKRGSGGCNTWIRDTSGEKYKNAGTDKNACVGQRLKDYNSWCGISDTKMQWNPPVLQTCANWTRCAGENGTCKFDGIKDIVYRRTDGKNPDEYKLFRNKKDSTPCNNSIQGDPAYGHNKSCYYCQPYTDVGSYKDTGNRALPIAKGRSYTPASCQLSCKDYTYFGIQDGNQCFCGNDLTKATKYGPTICGKHGGPWCNYIYKQAPPKI